jgi:hypothetical protein
LVPLSTRAGETTVGNTNVGANMMQEGSSSYFGTELN